MPKMNVAGAANYVALWWMPINPVFGNGNRGPNMVEIICLVQ